MTFAQYLIKLAVDKYNAEYGKSFDPSIFNIRAIPPNIRTDMGCEVYTQREDDFLRLRLYLVFSDVLQLIPYKVEVDKSNSTTDLTDEVQVTTGDIDFNFIKETFVHIQCGESAPVDPEDPIIPIVHSYLLKEQLGYILTEDNKKIIVPDINNVAQKDMYQIKYPRDLLNPTHMNLVNSSTFKGSISMDETGERIFISNEEGYGIANTLVDIIDDTQTYALAETAIVYKRSSPKTWRRENKISTNNIGNSFGKDISINRFGDLVAISAVLDNKIHLYRRSGITWYPLFDIINAQDVSEPEESYALDITLSNTNILMANRPFKEIAGNANNAKGLINVYSLLNNELTIQDNIILDIPNNYGSFGHKIEISKDGNRLIATNNPIGSVNATGNQVYVFTKQLNNSWLLEAVLEGSLSTLNDGTMDNISINADGSKVVIGANRTTVSSVTNAGVVYIFSRNESGVWTEDTFINNPDTVNVVGFGTNIKLSGNGNNLFIGTKIKRVFNNNQYKCYWLVYQYKLIEGVWTKYYELTNPNMFDVYTTDTFNNNLEYIANIDTLYDGSLVAIGTKHICYIFEDINITDYQTDKKMSHFSNINKLEDQDKLIANKFSITQSIVGSEALGHHMTLPIPTIIGDNTILRNQSKIYTISNYDISLNYVISTIDGGTVFRNFEEITYTAPNVAGKHGFIINDRYIFIETITLENMSPPIIDFPVNNTSINSATVLAALKRTQELDERLLWNDIQWELATDINFTNLVAHIYEFGQPTWNLTSLLNNTYYIRARYRNNDENVSPWSPINNFTINVVIVPTTITEEAMVQADDRGGYDNFSRAVDISGDGFTVIASTPYKSYDYGGPYAHGTVYIYKIYGETTWTQDNKITVSPRTEYDNFGTSIAITELGDRIIVGADRDYDIDSDTGAAYIFKKVDSSWVQEQKLKSNDPIIYDYFGVSVDISSDGSRCIIGAYQADVDLDSTGSAYIFSRSGSIWTQEQILQANDKQSGDRFGWSVAISGDGTKVIVGAPEENTGGTIAGSVYIFTYNGSTWDAGIKILSNDIESNDHFGDSVAISGNGNRVIVGAYGESTGGAGAGAAYIFTYNGSTWDTGVKIQASDKQSTDSFGASVGISSDGTKVIVGAYNEDTGGTNAGAAYIFTYNGTTWDTGFKLQASDKTANYLFGRKVAISNNGFRSVISSPNNNTGISNAGAAYIFS